MGVLLLLVVWLGYKILTNSSNTAVDAINKSFGEVNYVVNELPVKNGKLVFYIRNLNDNGIAIDIRYVKKAFGGWKVTRYGGEMSGAYHPSVQEIKTMPIQEMYLYNKWC